MPFQKLSGRELDVQWERARKALLALQDAVPARDLPGLRDAVDELDLARRWLDSHAAAVAAEGRAAPPPLPLTADVTAARVADYLRAQGVAVSGSTEAVGSEDGEVTLRAGVHVQVGQGCAVVVRWTGNDDELAFGPTRFDAADLLPDVADAFARQAADFIGRPRTLAELKRAVKAGSRLQVVYHYRDGKRPDLPKEAGRVRTVTKVTGGSFLYTDGVDAGPRRLLWPKAGDLQFNDDNSFSFSFPDGLVTFRLLPEGA